MEFLVSLAVKSLVIAGGTLALLKFAERRSASDRSLIAHLGLLALALLPLAAIALPALQVAGPAFLPAPAEPVVVQPIAAAPEVASAGGTFPSAVAAQGAGSVDWAFWAYVLPAGLLLLLTLIALGRLVALKARATVLVDPHWLSALAQAQHRMGFKSGTALLISEELSSPVSWGLMRPVILLNSEAVRAKSEAEAIIAHELAHVTRLDWAKLILSRVMVAMYWLNPFVWLLAREAHQLREEAADDAVLASDIEDTDYARLLVGIARHESRGLLIGAHGVAPSRTSLARRVRRVLDAASARAPGGWRWTSAAAFFAAGMAMPIAAFQFVNASVATASESRSDLADISNPGRPAGAVSAAGTHEHAHRVGAGEALTRLEPYYEHTGDAAVDVTHAIRVAIAGGEHASDSAGSAIDRAVELKAVGASPAYAAAMRSAAPHLAHDEIVELKAAGATPEFVRDLARSGYARLDSDDIVQARAMGIDGHYVRGMAAAGYGGLSIDRLVELKAVGVTPSDVARYRRTAGGLPSIDDIVEAKAMGLDPSEIEAASDP